VITSAGEWSVFAGSLFLLMGISLAAAARRSAEDALSWTRQWRAAVGDCGGERDEAPRRKALVLVYRFGGIFFASIGVGLLISAAIGAAPFGARERGGGSLLAGLFFTACGAVMSVNAWLRRARAPRFLDGELQSFDAPAPLGERVASACARAMIALFLLFGLRLLTSS
jgi:hypothetical protein